MNSSRRAAIIGVTGFIGSGLPRLLAAQGIETTGINRSGAGEVEGVTNWQAADAMDLSGHEMVINLAGAPINRRWTEANKRQFHASRVGVTKRIVEQMRSMPEAERPKVLLNGSAVGIYGDRGDEELSESAAVGDGYLAELCREWEAAAMEAEDLGVRVVCFRTGIVLGDGGGALEQLLPIFKLGLGGRLGSGRQWMAWIHLADLRAGIVHAVLSDSIRGPVNGSAPVAERNASFTKKLAHAVKRPAIFPVPGFALKLALGGFGGALLESQRAMPSALNGDGFQFRYPSLESALEDLLDS